MQKCGDVVQQEAPCKSPEPRGKKTLKLCALCFVFFCNEDLKKKAN